MPVICQECSVERAVAKLIIDQVARKVCQQCLDRAVAKQRPRTSEKPKAASGDPQRNCQHCQTKRATKKLYLHGTTDVVKLCDQCAAAMMTAPTTTTASTATQSGVQTPAATSARSVGTLPKEMPGRGKSPSSPVAAVTVTSAKGAPVKRTTSVATTLAARILPRLSTGGRRASAGAISKPIEHSAEEIALPSLAKLEKKIASESMCEQCGSAKATAFVHFDNRKRLACRKCVERFESLQRALAAPAPRRSSHSDAPVRASSTGGLPTATPRVRASEYGAAPPPAMVSDADAFASTSSASPSVSPRHSSGSASTIQSPSSHEWSRHVSVPSMVVHDDDDVVDDDDAGDQYTPIAVSSNEVPLETHTAPRDGIVDVAPLSDSD